MQQNVVHVHNLDKKHKIGFDLQARTLLNFSVKPIH